jgi:hypothetical protein
VLDRVKVSVGVKAPSSARTRTSPVIRIMVRGKVWGLWLVLGLVLRIGIGMGLGPVNL